jgi:hypothetical protein
MNSLTERGEGGAQVLFGKGNPRGRELEIAAFAAASRDFVKVFQLRFDVTSALKFVKDRVEGTVADVEDALEFEAVVGVVQALVENLKHPENMKRDSKFTHVLN